MRVRTSPPALLAALALITGAGLAGCGGDEQDAALPEPGSSATGPSCQDDTGDAGPGLDLSAVRLVRVGDRVRVIVEQNTFPPQQNSVVWTVGFINADASHSVALTTTQVEGTDLTHAIAVDDERADPQDDPVRITANAMTTTFPVGPIDDLGPGTRWYAVLSVDGDDVDFCPGGAQIEDYLDITPLALPERW